MLTNVLMPRLGESVGEGTVSKWLVRPGDQVREFQPLLEVDTDKVNAQVPSPLSGTVRELLVEAGAAAAVGAVIALIEADIKPADAQPSSIGQPDVRTSGTASRTKLVSPAVAAMAETSGIDTGQVRGTGSGGRVTKRDMVTAAAKLAEAPKQASLPVTVGPDDKLVALTRTRRLIADNMARAKATVPHAWQTQEVDMAGVVANRNLHKASFAQQEGFGLTYLPYVLAAAVAGLRAVPTVNSSFSDAGIVVHRRIHLGVAIGREDGVLVPVIRDADGLSIAGLARSLNDLTSRAQARALTADDLTGGTFTVNNSGSFGTLLSYSVINPGQAGILTMEAVVDRPVARGGLIGIRPMMYLCFSLDHRVLDGLAAARFLSSCRSWLEATNEATPIF